MSLRGTSDLEIQVLTEALAAYEANGRNKSRAAEALGIPRTTLVDRLIKADRLCLASGGRSAEGPYAVVTPPPPDEPIEALVARKKQRFSQEQRTEEWAKLIPVAVTTPGPIGLLLVGDPHVDDDGCDIARLEDDLQTVGRTPGAFVGHIGDLTNNWVGRLARLYAHQSTRFDEGLRLVQWMLGLAQNLFVVGGNHDCWNNGMDLLRFVVGQAGAASAAVRQHGARMCLTWPGGGQYRIHARHDFPGRSQFSSGHGMRRELLWGYRDDLLACGHIHEDEHSLMPAADGSVHALFRVSGYKVVDDYVHENNHKPRRLGPSVFVIINPSAAVPADRSKPWWDVHEGVEYLTWLRNRKGN